MPARLILRGASFLFVLLVPLWAAPQQLGTEPPFDYEPSVAKRVSYSQVVCAATISNIRQTGNTVRIGGFHRNEFIADALVDSVYKGEIPSAVTFRFYDFGEQYLNCIDCLTPPGAFYRVDHRYIVFLKKQDGRWTVAVPVYQMEIEIDRFAVHVSAADKVHTMADAGSELLNAVEKNPKTIGRMATRYFDWAQQLAGKDVIQLVEAFLDSPDAIVRYQAAWWLSFRKQTRKIVDVLVSTANDTAIEKWARDGALQRLSSLN